MRSALFIALFGFALTTVAEKSVYEIPLKDIGNKATSLKPHQGKVVLVVNVASQCGLTSQYRALQAVHTKYNAKGFAVLGFPCNQFGKQEPGTLTEIKEFCSKNYQVTFPMFAKIEVNGDGAHPLERLVDKRHRRLFRRQWCDVRGGTRADSEPAAVVSEGSPAAGAAPPAGEARGGEGVRPLLCGSCSF